MKLAEPTFYLTWSGKYLFYLGVLLRLGLGDMTMYDITGDIKLVNSV